MWVGGGVLSKVVATFNHMGRSFYLFMATTGDVWIIHLLNLGYMHVSSRIVDNISELSLLFSQQLLRPYWWKHYHKIIIPIFGLVLQNFAFPGYFPYIFSCDQAALQTVFSVCPSVRLSVCPSHLFDYVPIIGSSWNFQELLPMTNVRSMQKVKVRGQRSRSQRSQPNLTVSGL